MFGKKAKETPITPSIVDDVVRLKQEVALLRADVQGIIAQLDRINARGNKRITPESQQTDAVTQVNIGGKLYNIPAAKK